MYKVLIPQDINEEGKKYLKQNGYEVIVGSGWDSETIKKEVADCHALIVRTAAYTADIIKAGKNLKVIARYGVGTDNIDVKAAEKHGVYVTIAKNANTNSVSEHVMALILACAKNLIQCDSETRKGNWEIRNQLPGCELSGKILGIIGLGAIGLKVAKKAYYGLDMNIIGYNRNIDNKIIPDYITKMNSLEDVFRKADIVSLHVPNTIETRNMINKEIFNIMKPSSYLINTARGGVVNEDDLYVALSEKRIAYAAMDVFEEEPANKHNRLFKLNNFIASPHNAALTYEASKEVSLSAAKAVHDVLSGNKPDFPINNPIFT